MLRFHHVVLVLGLGGVADTESRTEENLLPSEAYGFRLQLELHRPSRDAEREPDFDDVGVWMSVLVPLILAPVYTFRDMFDVSAGVTQEDVDTGTCLFLARRVQQSLPLLVKSRTYRFRPQGQKRNTPLEIEESTIWTTGVTG